MKNIKLLIISIFYFYSLGLVACSCYGPTTFCESISDDDGNLIPTLVIVDAIISKEESEGMEVTIQEVLNGDFEEEKVFVKSDNGAECIHYTQGFKEGDNYIFILSEYYDDYALSFCHISFLKIENGILKGPIAPGIESYPYKDLGSLESCNVGLNLFFISSSLSFFPNPTLSEIQIKNIGFSGTDNLLQLEVLDVLGHNIRFFKKEEGLQQGEEWVINISELTAGVYFLRVIDKNKEEIFRIVKQ